MLSSYRPNSKKNHESYDDGRGAAKLQLSKSAPGLFCLSFVLYAVKMLH